METILRVFQVFLAIGLIGVVLLQRSEGGGLGIGSSGGAGSFMSVRGSANFLTRVTAIFGGLFMVTCLAMAIIAKPAQTQRSIFDVPATMPAALAIETPVEPVPTVPAMPAPTPAPEAEAPVIAPPIAVQPSPVQPSASEPQAAPAAAAKSKKAKQPGGAAPRGQ